MESEGEIVVLWFKEGNQGVYGQRIYINMLDVFGKFLSLASMNLNQEGSKLHIIVVVEEWLT